MGAETRGSVKRGAAILLAAAAIALASANTATPQEVGGAEPAEGPPGTEVVVTGNLIGCYGGPGEITSYYGFPKRVVYYWNPTATSYSDGQLLSDRLSNDPNDKSGLTEIASFDFGDAGWELRFSVPAGATPGYHFNVISFEPRCQRFYRDENGNEVEEDRNAYNVLSSFCVTDAGGTCPSVPGSSSPSTAASAEPSVSPTEGTEACTVRGIVKDHEGKPVEGVHIQLTGPGLVVDSQTDAAGEYRLERPVPEGSSFDPATDQASVTMYLEEFPVGRYQFFYKDRIAALQRGPFKLDGETCRKDLSFSLADAASPGTDAEWRDLWTMYRQFMASLEFTETELNQPLDYGLPLKVVTWCEAAHHASCTGASGAFYEGNAFGYAPVARPGIYIETGDSANKVTPDDTMYHEFGHALLTDAFDDAFPAADGRTPHGGYYANSSSNDAWIEGWASFYALMVSQRVEGRLPRFRYHNKSELDIETNLKAWDANGKYEEFAVTGALLDLVDGSNDYQALNPGPVPVDDVRYVTLRTAGGDRVIVGKIARLSKGSLARLFVEFLRGGQQVGARSVWVNGDNDDLRLGAGAAFWVPVPRGLRYDTVKITGLKNAELDDDPMDLELSELWDSLAVGSTGRSGNGKPADYEHIFDVADLYDTLSADFGGEDLDGDGVDDVDQIFISHGLHEDKLGDQRFDPGETVGLTSHPALGADGRPTGDAVIRYDVDVASEMKAEVTSNVEATVIAYVDDPTEPSRGYSYVAGNTANDVSVLVPPSKDTSVTLLALAEGHLPEVVGTVEAKEFWAEAEANPDTSFLRFDVNLQPGEVVLSSSGGVGPWLLMAGGALFLAAALAGYLKKRRGAASD